MINHFGYQASVSAELSNMQRSVQFQGRTIGKRFSVKINTISISWATIWERTGVKGKVEWG